MSNCMDDIVRSFWVFYETESCHWSWNLSFQLRLTKPSVRPPRSQDGFMKQVYFFRPDVRKSESQEALTRHVETDVLLVRDDQYQIGQVRKGAK